MKRRDFVRAQSAGEFLGAFMADHGLSYSELGRRSGMKSRSHPRDVVLGKKRLSLAGAQQVSRGLKLPPDLREFFLALVEHEITGGPVIAGELKKAREQVQKRLAATERDSREFYSLADVTTVYAALGSLLNGTDLDSVCSKTGLRRDRVAPILADLTAKGFVRNQDGRFYATDRHLAFSEIKAGGSFQKYYLARVASLRKRAAVNFDSKNELFWEATLSVRARDLPRFKEELRALVSRFAEGAEAADGEALRSLTLGFFDPR